MLGGGVLVCVRTAVADAFRVEKLTWVAIVSEKPLT